jgi:hypothetical protein
MSKTYNFGYLHDEKRLFKIFETLCEKTFEMGSNHSRIERKINSFATMWIADNEDERVLEVGIETDEETIFDYCIKGHSIDRNYEENLQEMFDDFYSEFACKFSFPDENEFIVKKCEECQSRFYQEPDTECEFCQLKKLTREEPCSICLEAGESVWRKLHNCNHVFHSKCLLILTHSSYTDEFQCPMCRTGNVLHMAKII